VVRKLLFSVVLSLIAAVSSAQPPPKEKEPPPDCAALEKQASSSVELLALGRCHEKAGKTASAYLAFKKAAAQAKTENAEGRMKQANEAAAALEAKLSKLTIEVIAPAAGLEIRRDGVPIPPEERGLPVAIDPGLHRIEASAPGAAPWSTDVQIQPNGDSQLVSVPELKQQAAAPAPQPETTPASPALPAPRGAVREEGGMTDRRIAGITLVAVGGAGIIVGAILGGLAMKEASDGEEQCPGKVCPVGVSASEVRDDIRPLAEGSTMTLVIGGAAAALGITLLIIDAACENELTVAVDPLGIRLRGSF
jgi:hypothetical protein